VSDIDLISLIDETIKEHSDNNKIDYAVAENFESHKYTKIDFSKNMTVFVGESSAGKSSFMRMLDWVMYNSLRGDTHITTGESECRGIIKTINGFKVTREITKSYNRYYITHSSWDRQYILEGFGVDVPFEVQKVLGAYKVRIDDKKQNDLKLNYLEQGQGWFLTSDAYTSTTKAKAVGLLNGVHYIDQAIKDTKNELNKVSRGISTEEKEIEELEKELKEYEYLDNLKNTIDSLEKSYKKADKLNTKTDTLLKLSVKYSEACVDLEKTREFLEDDKVSNIDTADFKITKLDSEFKNLKNLNRLNKEYKNLEENIKKQEEILESKYIIDVSNQLLKDSAININTLGYLLNSKKELDKLNSRIISADKVIEKSQGIDNAYSYIFKADDRIRTLSSVLNKRDSYLKSKRSLDNIEKVLNKSKDIEKANKTYDKASDLLEKTTKLVGFYKKVNREKTHITKLDTQLGKTKHLDSIIKKREKIKQDISKFKRLTGLKDRLIKESSKVNKEKESIKCNEEKLNNHINKYEESIKEVGVCPTCKSSITENVVEHLIKEFRK
jgi:exonuclease SbcC